MLSGFLQRLINWVFGWRKLPAKPGPTPVLKSVPDDRISLQGVSITKTVIRQVQDRRIVFEIKRAELISCQLQFGSPEEHPARSLIIGLLLMVAGVPSLIALLYYIFRNGNFYVRLHAALLFFGGVGVWLVWQACLSKRHYLFVRTGAKTKKFIFSEPITKGKIGEFLEAARSRLDFHCKN